MVTQTTGAPSVVASGIATRSASRKSSLFGSSMRAAAPAQSAKALRLSGGKKLRLSASMRSDRKVAAVAVDQPASSTASGGKEKLRFLTPALTREVRAKYGTPAYVYDLATLRAQATKALGFPNAFGLTARYAMKSSPNAAILQVFDKMGLHIDASSGYEVRPLPAL